MIKFELNTDYGDLEFVGHTSKASEESFPVEPDTHTVIVAIDRVL